VAGGNALVHAHSLLLVQGISSGNMAVEGDDDGGGDCDDAADTADYTATVGGVLALALAPGLGPAAGNTALQAGSEDPQL